MKPTGMLKTALDTSDYEDQKTENRSEKDVTESDVASYPATRDMLDRIVLECVRAVYRAVNTGKTIRANEARGLAGTLQSIAEAQDKWNRVGDSEVHRGGEGEYRRDVRCGEGRGKLQA